MKHRFLFALGCFLLAAALARPALAADTSLSWDQVYCFSQADFQTGDGVLLTQVPSDALGRLMLGTRQLRAGDAVAGGQLSELTFEPSGAATGDAVISCLLLTEEGPGDVEMTLKIQKNEPPVAEDSEFKTYRNIPGQVPLTASDPEGEALSVTIVKEPKRGQVTVNEDGTVTYTPEENKVGKDCFIYTVTDPAGNTSKEATVRIVIRKPHDAETYGDMEGDPALLAAVWLRDEGIYSGQTVNGHLLFGPNQTVSRGEFIAMCDGFLGADMDQETLDGGFADETPAWLASSVSAALRCGYLRGIPTADGLTLDAKSEITQAQAVSMVSSILGLSGAEPVVAMDSEVPVWAVSAVSSMREAGIYQIDTPYTPLTRREAALLLYAADQYSSSHTQTPSLLTWAAK